MPSASLSQLHCRFGDHARYYIHPPQDSRILPSSSSANNDTPEQPPPPYQEHDPHPQPGSRGEREQARRQNLTAHVSSTDGSRTPTQQPYRGFSPPQSYCPTFAHRPTTRCCPLETYHPNRGQICASYCVTSYRSTLSDGSSSSRTHAYRPAGTPTQARPKRGTPPQYDDDYDPYEYDYDRKDYDQERHEDAYDSYEDDYDAYDSDISHFSSSSRFNSSSPSPHTQFLTDTAETP